MLGAPLFSDGFLTYSTDEAAPHLPLKQCLKHEVPPIPRQAVLSRFRGFPPPGADFIRQPMALVIIIDRPIILALLGCVTLSHFFQDEKCWFLSKFK